MTRRPLKDKAEPPSLLNTHIHQSINQSMDAINPFTHEGYLRSHTARSQSRRQKVIGSPPCSGTRRAGARRKCGGRSLSLVRHSLVSSKSSSRVQGSVRVPPFLLRCRWVLGGVTVVHVFLSHRSAGRCARPISCVHLAARHTWHGVARASASCSPQSFNVRRFASLLSNSQGPSH
jgi:hypothetical protein